MPTCVGMTMWKQPLRHVEHYFPANYLATAGKFAAIVDHLSLRQVA
jgi:hypothetical protein